MLKRSDFIVKFSVKVQFIGFQQDLGLLLENPKNLTKHDLYLLLLRFYGVLIPDFKSRKKSFLIHVFATCLEY